MTKSTSSWSKRTQIQVVVAQLTPGGWAESLRLRSGDSCRPCLIEPCGQSELVSAKHLPGWGC